MAHEPRIISPNQFGPEVDRALANMLPQVMIALIKRMGGKVKLSAKEIDNTGGILLTMELDPKNQHFTFRIERKQ
jgi:hypothetical protein